MLLAIAMLMAAGAPAQPKPLEQISDAATFTALVHVPAKIDEPAPLLLYLHGVRDWRWNSKPYVSDPNIRC